jgi:hypothetical protein
MQALNYHSSLNVDHVGKTIKTPTNTTIKTPTKTLTDKAIVLDLDETLVHTFDEMSELTSLNIFKDPKLMDIKERIYILTLDDVVDSRGTGSKTKLWGIFRPHLKEFLDFCFTYFRTIVVWSAGKLRYVHGIVEIIFTRLNEPSEPHIVYSWDDCAVSSKSIKKPLTKMISEISNLSKYLNLTNTFVLDDRKSTFQDNPNNGILMPIYKPNLTIDELRQDDLALLQLIRWFKLPEVINSTDVRTLNKSNIFNETSVTPQQSNLYDRNLNHLKEFYF